MKRLLFVLILLTPTELAAQRLGPALWSAGYTRTIYLDAVDHNLKRTGPFNPSAALDSDRYGEAIGRNSWGNLVGERASCETVESFVRGGFLATLQDPSYVCTDMDKNDAKLVTRNGQTAAYDDMEAAIGAPPPPVTPECPKCPACAPCAACPPAPVGQQGCDLGPVLAAIQAQGTAILARLAPPPPAPVVTVPAEFWVVVRNCGQVGRVIGPGMSRAAAALRAFLCGLNPADGACK